VDDLDLVISLAMFIVARWDRMRRRGVIKGEEEKEGQKKGYSLPLSNDGARKRSFRVLNQELIPVGHWVSHLGEHHRSRSRHLLLTAAFMQTGFYPEAAYSALQWLDHVLLMHTMATGDYMSRLRVCFYILYFYFTAVRPIASWRQ
jgi:hypothetical protein